MHEHDEDLSNPLPPPPISPHPYLHLSLYSRYPRTIPAPGADLDGIFTLRTPEDAIKINARCEGATRVAVVGSSFIGMEAAAVLKQSKKIAEVHVIGMEKVPFERVLGPEVGGIMQRVHEAKGSIVFHMQRTVKKFHGEKGR